MDLFLAYLLGILTAVMGKGNNTTRPDDSPESSTSYANPDRPVTVMCIPPTASDEERAHKKKQQRRERIKFGVEVGGLIVLVVYAGFTIAIWCTMRKSNELTKQLVKDTYAADVTAAMGFDGGRQQVNVGFENHGKHSTIGHARYEIWLETMDGKRLRTIKFESFDDKIPSLGRAAMPNHYVAVGQFSDTDRQMYKNAAEVFKAAGTIRYDDGFGTEVNQPFCVATTAFAYMTCDGIDGFARSLPKKP